MPEDSKTTDYKSPVSKLAKLFRKGRDNWKAKYKDAKYRAKLLADKVRYWKNKAAELERRVEKLERELSESEKKNSKSSGETAEKFEVVPAHHTYSLGHMHLFALLVLGAGIGMRGASKAMGIFFSFLGLEIPVPCWTTGRLWLPRLGLHKLSRPKEKADDWIWIIDHTVQLGAEKCLVILGIRQKNLPKGELHLRHADVEPIDLIPVKKSNGKIVWRQLEECAKKTGYPRQIVCDCGTDIKSGVVEFCLKHDTPGTYDMKHKGAAVLKRELNGDPDWLEFAGGASKSGKKVQQTELSYMASPNQRSKARYMNAGELVRWGSDVVCGLDLEKAEKGEDFEETEMYAKFGWICEFREDLKDWRSLVEIVEGANAFVDFVGLYRGVHEDLDDYLSELPASLRFPHIKEELAEFERKRQEGVGEDETLLGSSEIIESVIGKYKRLHNDQVKGGFTGMILGLAAAVSDFDMDTIGAAIASTPTKKVWKWVKDNVGNSVYSQRKKFRKLVRSKEQKSAENLGTV